MSAISASVPPTEQSQTDLQLQGPEAVVEMSLRLLQNGGDLLFQSLYLPEVVARGVGGHRFPECPSEQLVYRPSEQFSLQVPESYVHAAQRTVGSE
jgi:hypothetical protein